MNYNQEINTQRCNDPISIGATCVAQIDGRFFLLIEIEIEVMGNVVEEVIIIEITAAQAAALIAAGVMRCQIVTTIPTGTGVNLICAFVVGANVFLVFNVENATDRLVLVRVPLCTII
ncbi:spore coat protein [Alkaliphilus sp. MSJ-5]|uniref:Spore coat protein n=1 Tax=Alkaliphilus flagellatus TaxID=2841507 RepID=A0ABS6G656_9FIRM|nr:spore coat protein [Alkaliphilus flagellatus]MBU5677967.1 spore coat protein [Alkaliphilus flagellatus]